MQWIKEQIKIDKYQNYGLIRLAKTHTFMTRSHDKMYERSAKNRSHDESVKRR